MSIGGIFGAGFWLVEHWYYAAAVLVVILGLALWQGFVSIAAIIKAILDIAAQIVKFFATPAEQIASKILYGVVCVVLSGSLFYQIGRHDEREVTRKAEVEHAAAMKRLALNAAVEADAKVKAATAAEHDNTVAAEQKANDYAEKLKAIPIGSCGLDDGDLAAGGVSNNGNRPNKRRHSK